MSGGDLKRFTVDRATWLRGTGDGLLLNSDGKKCCLGFMALACGYTEDEIRDAGLPNELGSGNNRWPSTIAHVHVIDEDDDDMDEEMRFRRTALTDEIVAANDGKGLDPRYREEKLTELFGRAGIEVEFVGETPKEEP